MGITAVITGVVTAVISFFDMLKNGFSWLKEILMVIGVAVAAVGAVILGAPAVATAVIAAIVAAVASAVVVIKQNWEAIKKWFGETCTAIGQFFSDLWDGVVEFAQSAWEKVGIFAATCVDGLKNAWGNFKTFMSGLWDGIVSGIKGAINKIIGGVNGMISSVVSGVNSVANVLNRISFTIPSWVPYYGGSTFGFSIPTFSAPQIPYLEEGGVLKKGQVGILEGKGGEAVIPLERNTEWINKMADAFMSRVQAGNYDLTGNAKVLSALNAIADRVTYRTPTIAQGSVLPYSVETSQGSNNSIGDGLGTFEAVRELSEKLDQILYLMDNLQFVADFGDNIRALARKVTKEQRREKISAGI